MRSQCKFRERILSDRYYLLPCFLLIHFIKFEESIQNAPDLVKLSMKIFAGAQGTVGEN